MRERAQAHCPLGGTHGLGLSASIQASWASEHWVSGCSCGSYSASASTSSPAGFVQQLLLGAAACVPWQGSCMALSVPQPTQSTDAVPAMPRCCVVGM